MAYHPSDNPDRVKAVAGVLAVHAALAAVILSGLTVHTVEATIERLRTFDITEVPPPPPPPPPSPTPERAKEKEGAAAKKALPTPVVAPPPEIVIPAKSPVVASRLPSTGSAPTAGAATSGTGTGAGGSGNGLGGGGTGARDYSRFTPAQLVRNLSQRDYRLLTGGRLPRGRAVMSLRVEPSGMATNCRVVRSSGDGGVDAGLCPIITQRLRFRPALDDRGQAIRYDLQYVATWSL